MRITRIFDLISMDSIRRLKICERFKVEVVQVWPKAKHLKAEAIKLNSQYDKIKLSVCLVVCIMLISVVPQLFPGAALQKPGNIEQQVVSAEPQAGPTGNGQEPARSLQTSRGSKVDHESVQLLAQVIEGEAADEPYQGKVAVGAVILNRTESRDFPNTIAGVVYQLDAFEAVSNGQFQRPLSKDSMNAAVDALNGSDPTGGALYFWNPAKSSSPWVWSRTVVLQIGRHVFAI